MADEDTQTVPFEALTVSARDLNRFLKAKGIDRNCPDCGSGDWLIPLAEGHDDGEDDAPVQLAAIPGIAIKRSIPVHTLMCKGCGTIKLIYAATVRAWVDENG